ncbi:MAG: HmuY family protein [Polyangiaceae bacterium]|nr:HmuY family protein [Polyangiaceae bacterium]
MCTLIVAGALSAACGGGDGEAAGAAGAAGAATGAAGAAGVAGAAGGSGGASGGTAFSSTPLVHTATLGAGAGKACYSLREASEVPCDPAGTGWDWMVEVQGKTWAIWTNGGVYGAGDGAAFGPMDEAAAAAMAGADDIPGLFQDERGGAFLDARWYAYDAQGTHDVSANYRVYVVDTGAARYRVQLLSYYGADGSSGLLRLRYGLVGSDEVRSLEVDARAGGFGAPLDDPKNRYTYLDLDTGEVLALTDAGARSSDKAWDLGFKRFNVISNGGVSGTGEVKTAIAARQDHLYDASGKPVAAAFAALTQADADAAFASVASADGLSFKADAARPYIINDGGAQSWFQFEIKAGAPSFFANPSVWWAIRGARRDAFAKLHVTALDGATHSYTVEMFVERR